MNPSYGERPTGEETIWRRAANLAKLARVAVRNFIGDQNYGNGGKWRDRKLTPAEWQARYGAPEYSETGYIMGDIVAGDSEA